MSKIPEFQRAVYFGIVRVLRECAPIIESNPKECVPFNVNKFAVKLAVLKENEGGLSATDTTLSLNDNNGIITVEYLKTFNASEIIAFGVEEMIDVIRICIQTNNFSLWIHVKKN